MVRAVEEEGRRGRENDEGKVEVRNGAGKKEDGNLDPTPVGVDVKIGENNASSISLGVLGHSSRGEGCGIWCLECVEVVVVQVAVVLVVEVLHV